MVTGNLAEVLDKHPWLYVVHKQSLRSFVSPALYHLGVYCDAPPAMSVRQRAASPGKMDTS